MDSNELALVISSSVGSVTKADKLAKLPLDTVELNPLNKLEYEFIIDSLPTKFVRSSCTKSSTTPIAPPPPPPPQAVKVVAITVANAVFFNQPFLIK